MPNRINKRNVMEHNCLIALSEGSLHFFNCQCTQSNGGEQHGRVETFTNQVLSQNYQTTKLTLIETESRASRFCWLLWRSELQCWMLAKSAKLLLSQMVVQPPRPPSSVIDSVAGSAVSSQAGEMLRGALTELWLGRPYTFYFSDCVEKWCFHITDDDERH